MPNIVVPSPLIFVKNRGLICIQNANLQLQAYKYNNLYSNTGGTSSGAKSEWDCTLGELALSFDLAESSGDETQVIVGCEQHIYIVKSANGKIEHLKKLQCVPSTVMVNPLKADPKDTVLIVSSFSHHILFYKGFELVWATK